MVQMDRREGAMNAIKLLNQVELMGRPLQIRWVAMNVNLPRLIRWLSISVVLFILFIFSSRCWDRTRKISRRMLTLLWFEIMGFHPLTVACGNGLDAFLRSIE